MIYVKPAWSFDVVDAFLTLQGVRLGYELLTQ